MTSLRPTKQMLYTMQIFLEQILFYVVADFNIRDNLPVIKKVLNLLVTSVSCDISIFG